MHVSPTLVSKTQTVITLHTNNTRRRTANTKQSFFNANVLRGQDVAYNMSYFTYVILVDITW